MRRLPGKQLVGIEGGEGRFWGTNSSISDTWSLECCQKCPLDWWVWDVGFNPEVFSTQNLDVWSLSHRVLQSLEVRKMKNKKGGWEGVISGRGGKVMQKVPEAKWKKIFQEWSILSNAAKVDKIRIENWAMGLAIWRSMVKLIRVRWCVMTNASVEPRENNKR